MTRTQQGGASAKHGKICIVGNGGWGTALALHLHSLGNSVTVWGRSEERLADIRARRENRTFLPGVPLPADLIWESDPSRAIAGANIVVVAAPSRHLGEVCARFRGMVPDGADVVSVSKGLDDAPGGVRRMSEIAAEALGVGEVAALSGPSHAEEVARGVPTAVVIAARDSALAKRLQEAFSSGPFRVYTSADPIGVEVGGAVKNIVAIAVGASDGLRFGDNTRAALVTRGLAEMARLGTAVGARPETFAGLSGLGDLVATCTSRHSRNRSVGERLGHGESIDAILGSMEQVAEGVCNCPAVLRLAHRLGVEMPITELVAAVLEGRLAPADAVARLLGRDTRPE